MTPTVSIIVPTFNQAQYLRACLDSIWFQDYPELEIIVVNDGSSDNTSTVLTEFQRAKAEETTSYASFFNQETNTIERIHHPRYPRTGRDFRIIEHDQNRGLAVALNTGFKAAIGKYCTYIPSDDMALPSMISEMVTVLESGADFVYSDMAIVDDNGHWVRRFSLPDYSFDRCFSDWYLCGVSKLYRTNLHQKYGWYDETLLAHDHELFLSFAEHGAIFRHIPKVLMYVRDHAQREIDIHTPSNWNRLLEESKKLVIRARSHKTELTQ